ncbi:NAD(P)-dependent alcohol dehydrogenase [Psychrobacillus sp. INOP01]|uniref:NAD(P)-dependent alcohol dehydrogenase n=1 Tax=Psychrobacillus sp. INOP01 TaxID=2829187 RepID=UPI001BAE0A8D|nr:NAD(P)-dependent alcohol dehydrogenase [Psychrobacillus sp. INOP01]QUG40421.1 NAD(P)-dependent alcohol dehydrogenase [Psychrobacillus sp. INOP01]
MKIKAAVTHGIGEEFKIEEITIAEPKSNEVLVKIVATGVCHTDATVRDTGMTPLPAVLGHEGAGIVEKVGENVSNVEVGDHVLLSFAACGKCESCLTGHPSYCDRFMELNMGGQMDDHTHRLHFHDQALSTFFGQSSFGTYSIVNSRNLVKVDKDVDLELLGPLGCGIQTGAGAVLNVMKPQFGSSIVVYGTGAVGLSAIMAAKIAGSEHIIAVDIHDNRLELALELGATSTINSKNVNPVDKIREITKGGSHYALDTTGVPAVVVQGIQAIRPRGHFMTVAAMAEISIPFMELTGAGKIVSGVVEGDSIPQTFIPQLIAYYKKGMFPFDKLLKFYNFENINEAFEDSKKGIAIKPVIKM